MVTVNKKSAAVIAGIVLLLMQSPMPAWASDAVNSDVTQASDSDFKSLGQLDLGGSNQPPATKEDLLASRKQYKENLKKYNKDLKKAESEYNNLFNSNNAILEEYNKVEDKIIKLEDDLDKASDEDFETINKELNGLRDKRRKYLDTFNNNHGPIESAKENVEKSTRFMQNTLRQIAEVEQKLINEFNVNINDLNEQEAQQEVQDKKEQSKEVEQTEQSQSNTHNAIVDSNAPVKPESSVTEEKAAQEKDSVQTQPKDSKVDSRSSDNKFASSEYRSSQVESLESKKSKAKSVEVESTTSSSVAARPAESSVTPFAPVSE